MMCVKKIEREHVKARRLGRDYKEKGYTVSFEPRGTQLPNFLREIGYMPDLIVKGRDGSIVIEVTSRDSVARLRELSKVSETIGRQPGWQFQLVMTNARNPTGPDFPVPLADVDKLKKALSDLLKLYELSNNSNERYSHAVLLLVWAIVEGILRVWLYSTSGHAREQVSSPHSLVRDGVMLGFLEMEDGEFLDKMASARNRVAHGTVSEKVKAQNLEKLVQRCESMLSRREQLDVESRQSTPK